MDELEDLQRIIKAFDSFPAASNVPGCSLADRILRWHSRHRVKVSREQVEARINHHILESYWDYPRCNFLKQQLIDDLLRLLNGEVEWCEHWHFYDGNWWQGSEMEKARQWILRNNNPIRFCDNCGKERPKS